MVTIAFIGVPGVPMAQAQDASAWNLVPHAAARLIAGATHGSADGIWLRAGIEIRLAPGWHTYWRYPGDSGVPPATKPMIAPAMIDAAKGGCGGASPSFAAADRADFTICRAATISNIPTTG